MLAPAPKGFRAAKGVQWAKFTDKNPPFTAHNRRPTGRRLAGIKYERRVHEHMLKAYDTYIPGPWAYFLGADGVRWCQVDGLMVDVEAGIITIVEIKYQHTTDAWWQVRKLYEPVLAAIFPPELWSFRMLEIVKWFDPAVPWPEPFRLLEHPERITTLPANTTGVHIWNP